MDIKFKIRNINWFIVLRQDCDYSSFYFISSRVDGYENKNGYHLGNIYHSLILITNIKILEFYLFLFFYQYFHLYIDILFPKFLKHINLKNTSFSKVEKIFKKKICSKEGLFMIRNIYFFKILLKFFFLFF